VVTEAAIKSTTRVLVEGALVEATVAVLLLAFRVVVASAGAVVS
jgi:hypothetical protein